ncbi:membrane protease YdiL (CAAX protease family) [Saccharothrix tamanrassetensis]|uniref:Membrane protease YdiL (CAAX protease family) n=1 Tax=Saccharothrix tamanrassetensis TaxID=1051531 RepID=A0A841CRD2_9PSEU|nr:type II CAAX endopeptidase family protein [Saccharothrix tamanrassetensis]MBB5958597.1 membrane protease YdiL (CAAX protease family) [Saccharothrix tamanrassetensis]
MTGETDVRSVRPGITRAITLGALTVFVAAPVLLLATGNDTIKPSTDSDEPLSLWGAVVPALAGILLVRAVPPRAPALLAEVGDRRRLGKQAMALALVAFLWPLALFLVTAVGDQAQLVRDTWALTKPIVYLALPLVILHVLRPREEPDPFRLRPTWWPRDGWRLLAPVPAVLVFAWLQVLGPFAAALPRHEDYPDPTYLAIAATFTFFTANVLEEVFFRGMLQTRLEALFGRWPGILLASLLFAWLHLPTHGQGASPWAGLPLTLGAIVVFQGVFGLFTGYLWSRYRNLWAPIAAHTAVNTLPLLLM